MNSESLKYIIQYLGILCTFFALIGISYQLIIYRSRPEKRNEAMKRFVYIFAGLLIVGSVLIISSVLYNTANNISKNVGNDVEFESSVIEFEEDEGNFLEKGFAGLLNSVNNWVLGSEDKEGLAKKVLGFENLGTLFFDKAAINLNGSTTSMETAYGPLTEKEWNLCMKVYYTLLTASIPLIVIMVGKTGIMYIYNSGSMAKIEKVKEDNKRWVFVIILLACAPMFLKLLFMFISSFSTGVYNSYAQTISTSPILGKSNSWANLKTGSYLVTAIMKFYYVGQYLMINAAFIARKWVLIVMLCLSPIIFTLWGINDKVHAFDIWFGEMITNATMGICYGLVFIIISLFIADGSNVIMLIIGLKMAIKLAETIRNSLQGFFTRMAGVNEMSAGLIGLGAAGGIMSGAFNVFRASSNGNVSNPMKGENNSFSSAFSGIKRSSSGNINSSSKSSTTPSSSSSNIGAKSVGNQVMSGVSAATSSDSSSNELGGQILRDTSVGNIDDNINRSGIGSNTTSSAGEGQDISDNALYNGGTEESANSQPYGMRNFGEEVSNSSESLNKESGESTIEPRVTTHTGNYGATAGQRAVDKLNTKIGENQEFSNVLGNNYNKYRAKNFGNAIGQLATSGSPELNKFSKGIADMSNGIFNAGAMAKSIYKASNHIASQRNADGEKANFKQTMSVAKEMLQTNNIKAENVNGTIDVDHRKSNGATSAMRGMRLIGAATVGKNDSIPKILINNSMQKKMNDTYIDWTKVGSFNNSENKQYFN